MISSTRQNQSSVSITSGESGERVTGGFVQVEQNDITGSSAGFSDDYIHRYWLRRRVGENHDRVLFVMLNPSTADLNADDPTIRRCKEFARSWGYGTLSVANIFAIRATDPRQLYSSAHEVVGGPDNDRIIQQEAAFAKLVICAWGNHGSLDGRGALVKRLLDKYEPHVLGLTQRGHPRHPLYMRADTIPVRW